MISERAPLEICIFPCLRKYHARRTARERSDRAGGGGGVWEWGAFPVPGKNVRGNNVRGNKCQR